MWAKIGCLTGKEIVDQIEHFFAGERVSGFDGSLAGDGFGQRIREIVIELTRLKLFQISMKIIPPCQSEISAGFLLQPEIFH